MARLLSLVESERRYFQEVIALIPVGLAVVAADLTILSVNRAFRLLFGLSQEEAFGRRLSDFLPQEDLAASVRAAAAKGEARQDLELSATNVLGRSLTAAVLPLADWEDDTRDDALVVIEEKTAPGRTDHELLGPLHAALWRFDSATSAIDFIHAPADQAFHRPPSSWAERIHPDDRPRVAAVYGQASQHGGRYVCEYRSRLPAGGDIWLRDVIHVSSREPSRFLVLTLEVTAERRAASQALQARKMDAAARLASRVSHDCNNLLMIMTGFGHELLGSFAAGDQRREDMQEILKAAGRLSDLTAQLLSLTRQNSRHPEIVDLNAIAQRRAAALRAESGGVELILSGEPETVYADASQLEQALARLAAWAAAWSKESGQAPAALELSTGRLLQREDLPDGLAAGVYSAFRIRVPDAVLEADAFERMLEPFAARSGARDPATELALAQTYAAIRQNGGDLAAGSGPDGTTFTVCLPWRAQQETSPLAGKSEIPAAAKPKLETVLVVDDEKGIRALVGKILARHGYTVLEAGTAEEALRVFGERGGDIRIVVTDVMLPQRSGPQLVEELRRRKPELRALYISGYTDDADLYSGALPPGTGFMQKPFTLTSLIDTVRAVLDAPPGQSTGAP